LASVVHYDVRGAKMLETFTRTRENPRLSINELTSMVSEVATEVAPSVEVLGILGAQHDTSYVEVLLGVRECDVEPCRIMVGLDRNMSRDDLRAALRQPILAYLRKRQEERLH
jgi:hypothetical protein